MAIVETGEYQRDRAALACLKAYADASDAELEQYGITRADCLALARAYIGDGYANNALSTMFERIVTAFKAGQGDHLTRKAAHRERLVMTKAIFATGASILVGALIGAAVMHGIVAPKRIFVACGVLDGEQTARLGAFSSLEAIQRQWTTMDGKFSLGGEKMAITEYREVDFDRVYAVNLKPINY